MEILNSVFNCNSDRIETIYKGYLILYYPKLRPYGATIQKDGIKNYVSGDHPLAVLANAYSFIESR